MGNNNWSAILVSLESSRQVEFLINNFIIFTPSVQDIEIWIVFIIGNSIQIQQTQNKNK